MLVFFKLFIFKRHFVFFSQRRCVSTKKKSQNAIYFEPVMIPEYLVWNHFMDSSLAILCEAPMLAFRFLRLKMSIPLQIFDKINYHLIHIFICQPSYFGFSLESFYYNNQSCVFFVFSIFTKRFPRYYHHLYYNIKKLHSRIDIHQNDLRSKIENICTYRLCPKRRKSSCRRYRCSGRI